MSFTMIPPIGALKFIDRINDKTMSDWLPIETAPMDGTPILVCYADQYVSNGFLPVAVRWRCYHPNAKGKEEFRDSSGNKVRSITHWMPLPPPPTRQEKEA